jgi:hypothetical protein
LAPLFDRISRSASTSARRRIVWERWPREYNWANLDYKRGETFLRVGKTRVDLVGWNNVSLRFFDFVLAHAKFRAYEKWNRWGKMPHFSQNRKFLQIYFLRKFIIYVS